MDSAVGDGSESKMRVPSFLTKTFDMVENSETNSLISWSDSGTSFIIWNHNLFSTELLSKNFKTDNFSSFVSQLNNYCFRKIMRDRHEYENKWFQSGKRNLLKNITRRDKQPQDKKKRGRSELAHNSVADATMETKLNAMNTEQTEMKQQIQNLMHTLDGIAHELQTLQANNTRLPDLEDDNTKVAVFLHQLMEEKRDPSSSNETKKTKLNPSDDESGSSTQEQVVKETTEKPADYEFWMNMLKDEDEQNAEQGDLAAQYAKAITVLNEMMESEIAMAKENLIAKLSDDQNEEDDNDGQVVVLWM